MQAFSVGGRARRTALGAIALAALALPTVIALPSAGAAATSTRSARARAVVVDLRPQLSASYRCSAGAAGSVTTSATIAGKTAANIKGPGSDVRMTGFQSTVSIPGSVFDKAYRLGVRSFSGKLSTFDIKATDARKSTVNVAKTPFKFGPIKLLPKNNPSATVNFPAKPSTIGPWVAKAAGTMTFETGTSVIVLTAPGLGSITAVCSPHPVAVLSTTTVH
jgi:hypothetical protein